VILNYLTPVDVVATQTPISHRNPVVVVATPISHPVVVVATPISHPVVVIADATSISHRHQLLPAFPSALRSRTARATRCLWNTRGTLISATAA
jgi:hypothetical protein